MHSSSNNPYDDIDLAPERQRAPANPCDFLHETTDVCGVSVTCLQIKNTEATTDDIYYTLHFPFLFENIIGSSEEKALPQLLSSLLPPPSNAPLLVVGIGNRALASDAVGPQTVSAVAATAHQRNDGIAVLIPGTEDAAGISARAAVTAYAKILHPRAVITVDALTTRSSGRLLSTIQVCNTGMTPGSGVRTAREELTENSLGCPVISLGIPTVISARALVEELSDQISPSLNALPPLFLSPHLLDIGLARGCAILADAINRLG